MTIFRPKSRGPETRAAVTIDRHPRYGLSLGTGTERFRQNGTVFACRDLICRMTSTIPIGEYVRRNGRLEPAAPAPWLSVDYPGGVDGVGGTLTGLVYAWLDSVLSNGMGFLFVTEIGSDGWPTSVEVVSPADMRAHRPNKGRSGSITWKRGGVDVGVWPNGPLVILHGYPVAGEAYSVSPIANAALTIDSALHAQAFAYQFFRDNAIPTGILKNDRQVAPTSRGLVLDAWEQESSGNRRTRILSNGWEYERLSVNPNESQFLETIQASDPQIARFFGVDPREIGASVSGNSTLTYQNPELDLIRLLTRTLQPWIVRIEQTLTTLRPRGRVVKFDTGAFLRMDTRNRYDAHGLAIRNGFMSVNEVRKMENLPEIDNGDQFLWPPMRTQLDNVELNSGADPTDPEFGNPPPNSDPANQSNNL